METQPLRYQQRDERSACIAWSADSAYLASAAEPTPTPVKIWSATGRLIATVQHRHPVTALAWASRGHILAFSSADTNIYLATLGRNRLVEHMLIIPHAHQGSSIRVLAWAPQSTHLASAGDDGALHLWDGLTGRPLATYSDKHLIHQAIWAPDGRHIVIVRSTGAAQIVDVSEATSA